MQQCAEATAMQNGIEVHTVQTDLKDDFQHGLGQNLIKLIPLSS